MTEKLQKPSKNAAIIAISTLLFTALVCGLWSLFWWQSHEKVKQQVGIWQNELREKDQIQLECLNQKWGGFPFRHELRCQELIYTHPTRDEKWELGDIIFVSMAWDNEHIIVEVKEGMKGHSPVLGNVDISWQMAQMSFARNHQGLQRIDLVVSAPQTQLMIVNRPQHIGAKRLEWHVKYNNDTQNVDLYSFIEGMDDGTLSDINQDQQSDEESSFLKRFENEYRPKNLSPPYAIASFQINNSVSKADLLTVKPISQWPENMQFSLIDGLFVDQKQAYHLAGNLSFEKQSSGEGTLFLSIADRQNLPPILAPLLFLIRGDVIKEGEFKKGVRFDFDLKKGDIYAGNTPLLKKILPFLTYK